MDDTIPSPQDTKSMDSPLGSHPYAQYRKCQSTSSLSLAAHFPPVPASLPVTIKDLKLGSWHSKSSSSMGSDTINGPVTAFVSFTGLSSARLDDISPPVPVRVAPHGCPYVKHGSGGITVILSGHKAGTSLPLYPSGSSISGVVFLSKLESVESLDVKVGRSPPLLAGGHAKPHIFFFVSSWKDLSLYARSRQASGAIRSFYLIGSCHGTPPPPPIYLTSSPFVTSHRYSLGMMGGYSHHRSTVG